MSALASVVGASKDAGARNLESNLFDHPCTTYTNMRNDVLGRWTSLEKSRCVGWEDRKEEGRWKITYMR